MRVLFVSPHFPWPLNWGACQRTFALLRALAARHDVTLVAPAGTAQDGFIAALGQRNVDIVHLPEQSFALRSFPEGRSLISNGLAYAADCMRGAAPYRYSPSEPAAVDALAGLCRRSDAIFCRFGYALALVPRAAWRRVILDIDDFVYRLLRQESLQRPFRPYKALRLVESLRTYLFEQKVFRKVGHTIACSERDLHRIRCQRKSVVRNGVTLPADRLAPRPESGALTFVAVFSYGPNAHALRWFVERVWPHVRGQLPETRLYVVGIGATREALPFAVAPGIEIIGKVESTATWFSRAVASVAPVWRGSGTRIKILESLACGRPVVATVLGAEGLEQLDEARGVFRANNESAMARQLIELLTNPGVADRVGQAGKEIVEAEYSWDATTASLATDIEAWIPHGNGLPLDPHDELAGQELGSL